MMMCYLMLKEAILQCFVSWVAAGTLKKQLVLLRTQGTRFRQRVDRCCSLKN